MPIPKKKAAPEISRAAAPAQKKAGQARQEPAAQKAAPKQKAEAPAKLDVFTENASEKKPPDKITIKTRQERASSLDIFADNTEKKTAHLAPRQATTAYHRPQTAQPMPAGIDSEISADSAKEFTYRHELKYYINYKDYTLLRNALRSMMVPDAYAGEDNSYHIRSLYFDDIYDSALREKIAGSDGRSKYRIRIYNLSDGIIKFEKKIKNGQYVSKKSISISRDEYERIMEGDIDFLKDREPLASEIYLEMKNNLLRPKVLVDYTREAYISPLENVRITFDKDLRGSLMLSDIFNPHAPVMPMFDTGMMVLEVKFNRYLPEFIRNVINSVNAAERSAISKYVLCRKFD